MTLFGSVRDDWIATDLAGWLAPNRIYPGVAEAVKSALAGGDEVYIVTTKQVGAAVCCGRAQSFRSCLQVAPPFYTFSQSEQSPLIAAAQARFTHTLLHDMAGINAPLSR